MPRTIEITKWGRVMSDVRCIDEEGREVELPEHLRDGAEYFECSLCGRKTTDYYCYHLVCGMTQPDGSKCEGVIQ